MPDATMTDDKCIMHTEKIHELELSMVEIKGDVKHIRERIDNGISATISKVWDKLNDMAIGRAKVETTVEDNSLFIDKLKGAFIWVSMTAVGGGIIALIWRLLHTYMTTNA